MKNCLFKKKLILLMLFVLSLYPSGTMALTLRSPLSAVIVENSPFGIWGTRDGYSLFPAPDIANMTDLKVYWEGVPDPLFLPSTWQDWKDYYNNYYENTNVTPVPIINLTTQKGGGGLSLSPIDYYNAIKEAVSYFSNINYWMLEVEVDNLHNNGLITVNQYALYTRLTYKALKDARPSAKLLTAGTGGQINTYQENGFFGLVFNELEKLENIEKNPNSYNWEENPYNLTPEDFALVFAPDSYDKYMDGHHFSNFDILFNEYWYRTYTIDLINAIKGLFDQYGYKNVILWDTQTGTYSGQPPNSNVINFTYQSEIDQANDLVRKYVLSLALGINKIFWTTTYEFNWLNDPENFFSKVGLIYNGLGLDDFGLGVKKLSYYTYKKMAEILEGSDWNDIQTIQESEGIYLYKFVRNNRPIWAVWNDNPEEKMITISGINSRQAKIIEAVPKYEFGYQVVDYDTAFNTEIKQGPKQ